jgi:hypothetical protein
MTQGETMQDKEPTRAQRMAAQLKAQGVLPPDIVRRTVKVSEKETPEQRERRRVALEKLRSFLD